MTRSFDVFDRDDFRNPDDLDRGASGGSESFWSVRIRLSELHREEKRADARVEAVDALALDVALTDFYQLRRSSDSLRQVRNQLAQSSSLQQ